MSNPSPTTSGVTTSTPRFNKSPRTDQEIVAASRRIPQESRPTDPTALNKLRLRATVGIDPPFTFLDLDNTDATLQHTYNVSMRVQSFEYVLAQFDMMDAFTIHLFEPGVEPPKLLEDANGVPKTVNLLTHYSNLTEAQVRAYILFLRRYGQSYDVQNLDWSQELFNNSCDTDLKDKVNEKVLGVHSFEVAGPLLFFHAMSLITTQTADAVRTLTLRVTNLNLQDIKGEKVGTAISQMRGALLRLKALDKVPYDMVERILDIMQTSSVDKFNRFFEALSFQLRLNPNAYKADDILHLAEKTHREFVASGEWTGVSSSGSTFTAGSSQLQDSSNTNLSGNNGTNRRPWRRTGPSEGASEVMTRNGSLYYWCGKCRLWNKTHKTAEHIKGGPTQLDAKVAAKTNSDSDSEESLVDDTAHKTFYSSFPVKSFPIGTPFQEGSTLALLTQQTQDLEKCRSDIEFLKQNLKKHKRKSKRTSHHK